MPFFSNCVRIPPRLPRNWPGPLGHPSLRDEALRVLWVPPAGGPVLAAYARRRRKTLTHLYAKCSPQLGSWAGRRNGLPGQAGEPAREERELLQW